MAPKNALLRLDARGAFSSTCSERATAGVSNGVLDRSSVFSEGLLKLKSKASQMRRRRQDRDWFQPGPRARPAQSEP